MPLDALDPGAELLVEQIDAEVDHPFVGTEPTPSIEASHVAVVVLPAPGKPHRRISRPS
jgi:hypothetical protein